VTSFITNQGYAAVTYEEFVAGMHQAANEVDVAEKSGNFQSGSAVLKPAPEDGPESAANTTINTLEPDDKVSEQEPSAGGAIFKSTAASILCAEPEDKDGSQHGDESAGGVPVQATISPTRPMLLQGRSGMSPAVSIPEGNDFITQFEDGGMYSGGDEFDFENPMEVDDSATGDHNTGTQRPHTPQGTTKKQDAPICGVQMDDNEKSIAPKRNAPVRGAEESDENLTSQQRTDGLNKQPEGDHANEKSNNTNKAVPQASDNDASEKSGRPAIEEDGGRGEAKTKTAPVPKKSYLTQEERETRNLPDDVMFIGNPDAHGRVRMDWSGGEIIRGARRKNMSECAMSALDRMTNLSLDLFTRRSTNYDDITTLEPTDANFNDKTHDCFTANFQKVSC